MIAEKIAHETATRKLVIENLVNGVPLEIVAQTFCKSTAEVMRDFDFALKKIKSYCFERALPAFICDNLAQAKRQQQVFRHFLDRVNLEVAPKHSTIKDHVLTEATATEMGLFK